jgi:OOP family OmpA-OmpF porin
MNSIKLVLILCCFIISTNLSSQNLVPNPSFEEHTSCPDNEDQLSFCKDWFNPTYTSPDYYNKCSKGKMSSVPCHFDGCRTPHSGDAYVGIINFDNRFFSYREYIGTKLLFPLKEGSIYIVSMFVSLSDSSQYYNNRFNFCFSNEKKLPELWKTNAYDLLICNSGALVYNDSMRNDNINWHLIQTEYIAHGGEEYLMIGLFKDDLSKKEYNHAKKYNKTKRGNLPYAYYYIDDVSVIEKK